MSAPDTVSMREVAELLRTFASSRWRSMTLQLHGVRVVVGKDGPPPQRPGAADRAREVTTAVPADAARAPQAPTPAMPPHDAADSRQGDDRAGAAHTSTTTPAARAGADTVEVRSPTVGVFWAAPNPGAPPFVAVGQNVAVDAHLAIVEVMKLMNPVLAPMAGQVAEICVQNADLVERDQVLFRLRPVTG